MPKKDRRYEYIKVMYDQGRIQSFRDIFAFIPKTVVAIDLGKKGDQFSKLIDQVGGFRFKEIVIMSGFFNLTPSEMCKLIETEYFKKINNLKPDEKP